MPFTNASKSLCVFYWSVYSMAQILRPYWGCSAMVVIVLARSLPTQNLWVTSCSWTPRPSFFLTEHWLLLALGDLILFLKFHFPFHFHFSDNSFSLLCQLVSGVQHCLHRGDHFSFMRHCKGLHMWCFGCKIQFILCFYRFVCTKINKDVK